MAPSVTAVFYVFFSEALSGNRRVLPNEVNIVLKGISHMVNFDNWQWVWKYLIVHIRLFKNSLCCNTVLGNLCFPFHFPFVKNIVKKMSPAHVTKFDVQKDSRWE